MWSTRTPVLVTLAVLSTVSTTAIGACTGPAVHVATRELPPYTVNVCEWDAASLTSAGSSTLCNAGFTIELYVPAPAKSGHAITPRV